MFICLIIFLKLHNKAWTNIKNTGNIQRLGWWSRAVLRNELDDYHSKLEVEFLLRPEIFLGLLHFSREMKRVRQLQKALKRKGVLALDHIEMLQQFVNEGYLKDPILRKVERKQFEEIHQTANSNIEG